MSITKINVTQITDWLLFRKSTNRPIVIFLGSRTGGLFENKKFYEQMQAHSSSQFDTLNELEKFYECYQILSQLNWTEGHNILTSSIKERPQHLSEYKYLATLIAEGFVDIIITTNIDSLLEEALQREKVKESRDYQILVYGEHSIDDITYPPANSCTLLKIFGDLNKKIYKVASNEFDLRADKKLRGYLETLLARDILVIGYDREWDCPLDWAFPYHGGDFIYVNETPPTSELLLTRALRNRKGSYLALLQQKKLIDFMRDLHSQLNGKIPEDNSKATLTSTESDMIARRRIFISYSHKDAVYMLRLKQFLQDYNRRGLIDDWDDTKIDVGRNWFEEIKNALRTTKAAILLLSVDFFASEFINKHELPVLLEGAKAGEIELIPVILSPCNFSNSLLSSYQTVNPPNKPLKSLKKVQRDKIWEEVALLVGKLDQNM